VDNNLIRCTSATPDDEPRFSMLETIREFARESLAASGEEAALQRRHALFFLALAEAAEPHLTGAQQAAWLARLEGEHDNLRAVLRWAQERAEHHEIGLRLAAALWRFWEVRGHLSEGRAWLEALLTREGAPQASGEAAAVRATALTAAGNLAFDQGDYAQATILYDGSLALWRALGDKPGIAAALANLGLVAYAQGDYGRATMLHEEGLALFRALGDQRGIAASLTNLGIIAQEQGDYARASALHEESVALFRALGDTWGTAAALANLGNVVRAQGHHRRATALYDESLALRRRLGDKAGIADALANLGRVAQAQSDWTRATALFAESLTLLRELGDRRSIVYGLEGLAAVATAPGTTPEALERAVRLLGAAAALRGAIGAPLPPNEQAGYARTVAALRAALGEAVWPAAWAAGQALSLKEVLTLAVGEPSSP
jgi:tetratricopeptide (TPR) repeat protein